MIAAAARKPYAKETPIREDNIRRLVLHERLKSILSNKNDSAKTSARKNVPLADRHSITMITKFIGKRTPAARSFELRF